MLLCINLIVLTQIHLNWLWGGGGLLAPSPSKSVHGPVIVDINEVIRWGKHYILSPPRWSLSNISTEERFGPTAMEKRTSPWVRLEPESKPCFEHLAKILRTYLDLFRSEIIWPVSSVSDWFKGIRLSKNR